MDLVEILQKAIKACEGPAGQFESDKQQIAKQFVNLRRAVYTIVDEETIILTDLKWKKEIVRECLKKDIKEIAKGEAEKIASTHGYNLQTVYNLLLKKNTDEFQEKINVSDVVIQYEYKYWTFE